VPHAEGVRARDVRRVGRLMRFVRYWLPVVLCAAGIWYASSLSSTPLDEIDIPHLDKVLHALEYGVLGWLVALAIRRTGARGVRQRSWLVALVLVVAYGVTDEIHQTWVPHRDAAVSDLVADGAGGLLGGVLCLQYLKAVALMKAQRS